MYITQREENIENKWKFHKYSEQKFNFTDTYHKRMGMDVKTDHDTIIAEPNDFALVSHIYWISWSFVQAQVPNIQFGYKEYADALFDAYQKPVDLLTINNHVARNKFLINLTISGTDQSLHMGSSINIFAQAIY